jgi:hypothetical protein
MGESVRKLGFWGRKKSEGGGDGNVHGKARGRSGCAGELYALEHEVVRRDMHVIMSDEPCAFIVEIRRVGRKKSMA